MCYRPYVKLRAPALPIYPNLPPSTLFHIHYHPPSSFVGLTFNSTCLNFLGQVYCCCSSARHNFSVISALVYRKRVEKGPNFPFWQPLSFVVGGLPNHLSLRISLARFVCVLICCIIASSSFSFNWFNIKFGALLPFRPCFIIIFLRCGPKVFNAYFQVITKTFSLGSAKWLASFVVWCIGFITACIRNNIMFYNPGFLK